MTTATIERKFTVNRTYTAYEGGPECADSVEFTDGVDAQDYAECLYRTGRVSRAVCIDPWGRAYFSVSREQFDFND